MTNPPPQAAGAAARPPGSQQKDSTINYEVDKTLRVTQQPMGGIRRLSVAVVVNHRTESDRQGKPVTRALRSAHLLPEREDAPRANAAVKWTAIIAAIVLTGCIIAVLVIRHVI